MFRLYRQRAGGTVYGIPPTGKRVQVHYTDFWQVRDDRIADNWVTVDFPRVLAYLGADCLEGNGWEVLQGDSALSSVERKAAFSGDTLSPNPVRSPEETARNEALVRSFLWDLQSPGGFAEGFQDRLSPDFVCNGNQGIGTTVGVESFFNYFYTPLHQSFSDLRFRESACVLQGDWVSGFGELEAAHTGGFMGLPASGKQLKTPYVGFWQVQAGKLVKSPFGLDVAGVCRDLFRGEGWEAFDRGLKEPPITVPAE